SYPGSSDAAELVQSGPALRALVEDVAKGTAPRTPFAPPRAGWSTDAEDVRRLAVSLATYLVANGVETAAWAEATVGPMGPPLQCAIPSRVRPGGTIVANFFGDTGGVGFQPVRVKEIRVDGVVSPELAGRWNPFACFRMPTTLGDHEVAIEWRS